MAFVDAAAAAVPSAAVTMKVVAQRWAELAIQPCLRKSPVLFHRGRGDAQDLGGLLDRETREIAKLDDSPLARIEARKLLEDISDREHVDLRAIGRRILRGKLLCSTSFQRLVPAGVI